MYSEEVERNRETNEGVWKKISNAITFIFNYFFTIISCFFHLFQANVEAFHKKSLALGGYVEYVL